MAFDLTCLTAFQANASAAVSSSEGTRCETTCQSAAVSIWSSGSWTNKPPKTETISGSLLASANSTVNKRKFFFFANNEKASAAKTGAITISRKMPESCSAVARSTGRFNTTMPPKIDTGSASKAFWKAAAIVSAVPIPQGFICFRTTATGAVNSWAIRKAASASLILL